MELEPPAVPAKRCPTCKELKPLDEFPRNRSTKDGRAAYCKPCHNQRMREIAERLYGGNASFNRMRRYGISSSDVEEMVRRQGGVCAICGAEAPRHVDHDHKTGQIRGILCFSCNRGLGKVEDDVEVLRGALRYLGGGTAP